MRRSSPSSALGLARAPRMPLFTASCIPLVILLVLALASGCGDEGDPTPDVDAAPPAGGTITIAWQIEDPANPGITLTCGQVAASGVRLTIRPVGGGSGDVDSFSCDGGMATTRDFNPGQYNMELALTAGLKDLVVVPVMGVTLEANNNTQLAGVTFAVRPRGNLQFQVGNSLGRPNCTATPAGAGMTEVSLQLRDADDTCIPTTFILDPDNAATSYPSDCQNPTPAVCIENDVPISAVVNSGSLKLAITGRQGNETCFTRVSQFTVPGNDLDTQLPTQTLLLDDGNGNCITQ